MKLYSFGKGGGVLGLTIITAFSAKANSTITVQEEGVSPFETPTITCTGIGGPYEVYAGVNQLVANGTPMNGFCIDPFHWSMTSSGGYSYVALASAPKGYAMGSDIATDIERLWGSYYSMALTSANSAAGLQIAIWKLVGGSHFTLNSGNDYGAAVMIAAIDGSSYTGPVADLIGLTGPGQDYVVQNPPGALISQVPDGGATFFLLGAALCGLAVFGNSECFRIMRHFQKRLVRSHHGSL